MELRYETRNGIANLTTPQMVDLSTEKNIEFIFTEENGILEVNKMQKYAIKFNRCKVPISNLNKGTNTLRVITEQGEKITPCQPIFLFDVGNKLHNSLATSLDMLDIINTLQAKVIELQSRINEIEKNNVSDMKEKLNELIALSRTMQERISSLEVGFDPTVMIQ